MQIRPQGFWVRSWSHDVKVACWSPASVIIFTNEWHTALNSDRCPPPQLTRGLGEHQELPQWRPGCSPTHKRNLAHFKHHRTLLVEGKSPTIQNQEEAIANSNSTLLCVQQIMEYTECCVSVSEPMSPIIVAMKYRKFGDSPEIRQLARDVMRWECRPYPTVQPLPLGYFVKFTSICIVALPLFR